VEFVVYLVEKEHLKEGDCFILDNCKIHCADDSFHLVSSLLRSLGITLMFLPKYSPEFNPCELVFQVAVLFSLLTFLGYEETPLILAQF